MAKFHVNNSGKPGECHAGEGKCPFGNDAQHYATKAIAQQAFELSMGAQTSKSVKKYKRPQLTPAAAAERDKLFLTVARSHSGVAFSAEAKTVMLQAMASAYEHVSVTDDNFAAAEKMNQELELYAARNPESILQYDHIYASQAATFSYLSPVVDRTSRIFERALNDNGWDTRSGDSLVEFERTFTEAALKSSTSSSGGHLAENFESLIASEDTWAYESTDDTSSEIKDAALKAGRFIRKNKQAFLEELKFLQ